MSHTGDSQILRPLCPLRCSHILSPLPLSTLALWWLDELSMFNFFFPLVGCCYVTLTDREPAAASCFHHTSFRLSLMSYLRQRTSPHFEWLMWAGLNFLKKAWGSGKHIHMYAWVRKFKFTVFLFCQETWPLATFLSRLCCLFRGGFLLLMWLNYVKPFPSLLSSSHALKEKLLSDLLTRSLGTGINPTLLGIYS